MQELLAKAPAARAEFTISAQEQSPALVSEQGVFDALNQRG